MSVNTVTGYTQALSYFKMAYIIYSLLLSRTESKENMHNLSVQSKRMEDKIDLIKKLLAELTNSGEDRNMDKFDEVRKAKEEYEDSIKAYGLNSLQALYNGLTYVKIMQHVSHFINKINKPLNKLSQFLLCTKWIDEGLFDCRDLHHSKVATGRREHLPDGNVSPFGNNPAKQMSVWIASNRLRV